MSRLPLAVVAGVFVLMLGDGAAAWPTGHGGHPGSHVGRGGHLGVRSPFAFGQPHHASRKGADRRAQGHTYRRDFFFPYIYDYGYGFEVDYEDAAFDLPDGRTAGKRQQAGFCDVSPPFPKECVWKESVAPR
jgi:hypothetical protein